MRILHINAGLEQGGGLFHIVNLLKVARLEQQDFTLLTFADGPVAAEARKVGAKVDVLGIDSRYDLRLLQKLKRYINKGNFDIVHTHGARANLFMSMISGQIPAKWVITVHSDPTKDFGGRGFVGRVFTKLNLRSLRKADRLLAVTQNFKNLLVQQVQVDPAHISVIYNGIFFDQDEKKQLQHAGFNIINVARMEPIKGQMLLLQALSELKLADLKLHFVGDGSALQELKEYVKAHGMNENVVFHGFLPQSAINDLYQTMDLAVLTSYSESFPLVLLEAANAEVPILSTNVGDIEKMIPDEQHGFVASIGDGGSIKNAILKAYSIHKEQPSTLNEMAQIEKSYLSANFSMVQQLNSIESIYRALLNN